MHLDPHGTHLLNRATKRRARAAMFGALLSVAVIGCKREPPPAAPRVAPSASVAAPRKAERVARGRVLGHAGAPVAVAHVRRRGVDGAVEDEVAVRPDGAFTLALPETARSIVRLEITGAGHERSELFVAVDDAPVDVDVRLGTYTPKTAVEELEVLLTRGKAQVARRPMKRAADGTFVAELPAPDGTYTYEIAGLTERHSYAPAATEGWEYDGDGDYASVITVTGGTARVTLDPTKLAPATPAVLHAGSSGSMTARMNEIESARAAAEKAGEEELMRAMKAGTASGPRDAAALTTTKRAAFLASSKDERPLVRQFATLAYFSIGWLEQPTDDERAMARRVANELAPDDPLWLFGSAEALLNAAGDDALREAIIAKHPSAKLVAKLLRGRLLASKDIAEQRRIVAQLRSPRLKNTLDAYFARRADPDRVLAPGKPAPAFDVPAIEGDRLKGTHSAKSLAGKVYLMDVWATWCVPCVAELPKLHKLHEQYGKRLEILSVTFDEKPSDVAKFRADKTHPMPWLHGLAGPDPKASPFYSAMGWAEESQGIPFVVLVGADGKILASTPELTLEALPSILDRVLTPATPAPRTK